MLDGKSGNKEAEKAVEEAEKKNVSKEQVKKTGSVIMNKMKEVSEGYRKVERLGDAAVWNIKTNILNVLTQGIAFEIYADVNNDTEEK